MAPGDFKRPVVKSSLPFQMLMFFNSWYFALFFVLELALFIYKGLSFPYSGGALAAEIILIFILAGLEAIRIFLVKPEISKGAKAYCASGESHQVQTVQDAEWFFQMSTQNSEVSLFVTFPIFLHLTLPGYKGNLTESVPIIIACFIFSLVSFFGVLYLLLWQTYVLRADVILTSIEIAFIGLEMILCITNAVSFSRNVNW